MRNRIRQEKRTRTIRRARRPGKWLGVILLLVVIGSLVKRSANGRLRHRSNQRRS